MSSLVLLTTGDCHVCTHSRAVLYELANEGC
jgi:hypothetical protein